MKVSLRWIEELSGQTYDRSKIVEKITSQIAAVESVTELGSLYEGILVVEIKEKSDHPDADKLGVYMIDNGSETIQVVAGDKSLSPGDKVAHIAPGLIVPSTAEDADPLKVDARELRGVMSNGMLASASELGFNDDHSSVLVLDSELKVGSKLTDCYNLDDLVVEVENKALTHRPDCWGMLGFAREVAAIHGYKFTSPEWFRQADKAEGSGLELSVDNKIPDDCPRFLAQSIASVKIGPSPIHVQSMLARLGVRPINNIVDLTNYIMLLSGQPFHAFDYDEVAKRSSTGAKIVVRHPNKAEKLTLLDGKTIEPHDRAAVVATDKELISVGGAMGGADTEVSDKTKNIILEAANWNLYSIRSTSMKHGLFSEAVARFARGQDPNIAANAHALAVKTLQDWSGGTVASQLVDNFPKPRDEREVSVEVTRVNALLGAELKAEEIKQLLENVELEIKTDDERIFVTAPTWRPDLNIEEDLVEEIGRLHGYDNIRVTLPARTLRSVDYTKQQKLEWRVRNILSAGGANEQLSYNFVSRQFCEKFGFNLDELYRIRNALSPELEYLRPAILPSLIVNAYPNHRMGYGQMALFEINKEDSKIRVDSDNLPQENKRLAFLYSADEKTALKSHHETSFYQAKHYLDYLLNGLNVEYELEQIGDIDVLPELDQVFHSPRRALVKIDGKGIGVVGEFSDEVHIATKLPIFAAGFELDLEKLTEKVDSSGGYKPLSKFPSTTQDVTFQVSLETRFGDLRQAMKKAFDDKNVDVEVSPLDLYRFESSHAKNLTYRLTFRHNARTLKTSEVNQMMDKIAEKILIDFDGAERV